MSGWIKWFWFLAINWFVMIQAAQYTTTNKSLLALNGLNTLLLLITLASCGMYLIGTLVKDTLDGK